MTMDAGEIPKNLSQRWSRVKTAIQRLERGAGRLDGAVTLIAVTKSQPFEVIPHLYALGCRHFGENRSERLAIVRDLLPPDAHVHGIGRIQSRQIPHMVAPRTTLHSLADLTHVPKLLKSATEKLAQDFLPFPVFIQVNLLDDQDKAGLTSDEAKRCADMLRSPLAANVVNLLGLMTMAPPRDFHGDTQVELTFATCEKLAKELGLSQLSMGMSGDYDLAIRYGATHVRLGSTLFADENPQLPSHGH